MNSPVSTVDLHIHTFYSDGKRSPEQVIREAASIGLRTVAIADHDNAHGARAACHLAQELGIRLVPAIELTCRWDGFDTGNSDRDIDMLGYFTDLNDPEFQRFEQAALDDVHARIADCCALLKADGYAISIEDAFAENPRYAGLLQLIFAMQHTGCAPDWDRAFGPVQACWRQVRPSRFTIQQAIEQIQQAGGVAILAHPTSLKCGKQWLGADQIAELIEMGLDGLEVYHPRVEGQARDHFLSLAQQFDLLVSGGSDAHGWFEWSTEMGTQPVTAEMVEAICARIGHPPPGASWLKSAKGRDHAGKRRKET